MSGLWLGANLLCHVCTYASGCENCCKKCEDTCNSAQRCFYDKFGNDFFNARMSGDWQSFRGLHLFEVWEDRFREDGFGREMDKILGNNNKERTHASPTATQGDFLRKSEGTMSNQIDEKQEFKNSGGDQESTIAKVDDHSQGVQKMYDAELGDYVDITPAFQRNAAYVHGQIQMGTFAIALAIKKIYDEKLYLGLGCSSKEEYANRMLPFSRKQANKYYRVADRISQYMPQIDTNDAPGRHLDAPESKKFSEMGIRKLYELTKVDDADFEELMEGGDLNGHTLEEFKAMTVRQATEEIAKIRKVSGERISILEEKNKYLQSENETLKEKETDARERMKNARDLEYIYGEKKMSSEVARQKMSEAGDRLAQAQELIVALGSSVDNDSPELIRKSFYDIYNTLMMMVELFQENNYEMVQRMSDIVDDRNYQ